MMAPCIVAPWLGHLADGPLRIVAIAFVAAGVAFAIWATQSLGKAFTPFPRPNSEGTLSTTGPYGLARHPIYSGIILSAAAWAVLWQSLAGGACAAILFIFFDLKSRREELWLEEKFPDYPRYRARVKRLIPFAY
jgi:protein-S-isoprenylcysteine O-methyltransferase Ste14